MTRVVMIHDGESDDEEKEAAVVQPSNSRVRKASSLVGDIRPTPLYQYPASKFGKRKLIH